MTVTVTRPSTLPTAANTLVVPAAIACTVADDPKPVTVAIDALSVRHAMVPEAFDGLSVAWSEAVAPRPVSATSLGATVTLATVGVIGPLGVGLSVFPPPPHAVSAQRVRPPTARVRKEGVMIV